MEVRYKLKLNTQSCQDVYQYLSE